MQIQRRQPLQVLQKLKFRRRTVEQNEQEKRINESKKGRCESTKFYSFDLSFWRAQNEKHATKWNQYEPR